MIEAIGAAVIPAVVLCAAIPMLSRRRNYFAVFTAGAREGLETAARLLPTMIALSAALAMFQASGAPQVLSSLLAVPAAALGIPTELLPLTVIRPISGSASTAAYARLLETAGADSFAALCASVLMGSSDTVVYVLSVYFSGAAGVRRTRHAIPVAAAAAVLCVLLACAVSRMVWLRLTA